MAKQEEAINTRKTRFFADRHRKLAERLLFVLAHHSGKAETIAKVRLEAVQAISKFNLFFKKSDENRPLSAISYSLTL